MKTRWLPFLLLLSACTGSRTERQQRDVDSLNERAWEWQYRDIDSLRSTAVTALERARQLHYVDGEAEALSAIMAERFQQMDFDSAQTLAHHITELTQNQVEQLVADVMLMRIAQRTSDNRAFFIHRSHALRRVRRIAEEEQQLTPHMARRFDFARSDLHIVASTYFYYVDQQERALDEIRLAEPFCQLPGDTAQWLYYCYMRGSGGLSDYVEPDEVTRDEFDYLFKCFTLAKNHGYLFFQANAEQSLATLFADSTRRATVRAYKPNAEDYLLSIFGADSTARHMAEAALECFTRYDDLYQQACALRTLGELAVDAGLYEQAIDYFASALSCVNFHHLCYYAADEVLNPDSTEELLSIYVPQASATSVERRWMESPQIQTVPEWIAGIRQQLSVAFSAMDMKPESDYNRNIYLDLLDATREDAELESRYEELQAAGRQLHWALLAVALLAVAIIVLILLLRRTWRKRSERQMRLLRQTLQQSVADAERRQELLEEEQEQLQEQQQAAELRIQRDKQRNIEKRAKLQLVHGITPFLDRIIHEVNRMQKTGTVNANSLTYISELTDRITAYNDLLTRWIQMEQGQLSLQLSTFPLQPLFDSLAKSHFAYEQQGLTLSIQPTDLQVKADRALTLFMLNTLADNARKFTPKGGTVTISATAAESPEGRYVELSVQDTGIGLSARDIDLILNNKVYDAAAIGCLTNETRLSHQWDSAVSPVRQSSLTGENPPSGQALESKPLSAPAAARSRKGFGFGLLNCKGIIEKYRKTAPLFSVCQLGIESRVGEGSRFFFRLPRVLSLVLLCLPRIFFILLISILFPFSSISCKAASSVNRHPASIPTAASAANASLPAAAYSLADSVYFCNLAGRHAAALDFADSALSVINHHLSTLSAAEPYEALQPGGSPSDALSSSVTPLRLTLRHSATEPADFILFHSHLPLDFSLLLGLRNEIAVAALALHDWPLYRYNNHLYTHLYKLANQDASLEAYCLQSERSQANTRVAIVLIVLLFLLGLAATWFFYFRPQLRYRQTVAQIRHRRYQQLMAEKELRRQKKEQDLELAGDEVRRRHYEELRLHVQNQIIDNCLSTIKHETMYYPGRIHQLVQKMQASTTHLPITQAPVPEASPSGYPAPSHLLSTLAETAAYYKEIFTLLAAQADSQSAAVAFRRHRLSASSLLHTASTRFSAKTRKAGLSVTLSLPPTPAGTALPSDVSKSPEPLSTPGSPLFLGDQDQLTLLFDSLFDAEFTLLSEFQPSASPAFSLTFSADPRFIRFTLHNPTVSLPAATLHDFFTPPTATIPALIAKQIIREHDTFLSHPGCRITAEAAAEGHVIWFTLPIINSAS